MKNKLTAALCCAVLVMVCLLSGCQLAQKDDGVGQQDKIIGVLITTEYLNLFDIDGYLKDNAGSPSGDTVIDENAAGNQKYQGRLYATLEKKTLTDEVTGKKTETEDYVFPGIEGISYFSATRPDPTGEGPGAVFTGSDDAISDGKTNLNVTDSGTEITMEGTIYASPDGTAHVYYFNPVHQSTDGRVYVTGGNGCAAEGTTDEGIDLSQTMTDARTSTVNGKAKTDRISVKVTVSVMKRPTEIAVLQMSADSAVLSRAQYKPGEVPKTLVPLAQTAYLIVETSKTDSTGKTVVKRELYDRSAQSFGTFACREDGICVKHDTGIEWPK